MDEDLERYADYNDIEDDAPHGKSPVLLILKIMVAVVCFAVVGFLAFRLILFKSYPAEAKTLVYTDALSAYYDETDGAIGAKTQVLRYPYDDANDGNFFCDHLIVVEGANHLQVALRYNVSSIARLSEKYGKTDLSPDDPALFSYRLVDDLGNEVAAPSYDAFSSRLMYRYHKLAFDGVTFGCDPAPAWIRLEVFFAGEESEPIAKVLVYENNDAYSAFSDYRLSEKERR